MQLVSVAVRSLGIDAAEKCEICIKSGSVEERKIFCAHLMRKDLGTLLAAGYIGAGWGGTP